MKKHQVQQRTERRISAALRLGMVAVLLVAQIALVFLLSDVLKQRMALAYSALELLAAVVAITIWSRPGATSYKISWIMLVLFVPVVGVILYLLWNGARPSKRLDLKKLPRPEEPVAQQEQAKSELERLRLTMPQWYPAAAGLSRKGFLVYRDTGVRYLPSGEAYLNTMLDDLEHAERFIFLEYFIVGEGEIWDRLSDVLCRKSGQGVEVKLIFDDFGSMLRLSSEKVEALTRAGVEVKVFNPVHHYVNRLYFNYRDHRKITCIDGDTAYTGGANIADEYANLIVRFGYWKDCGIRLEGEGTWGLTRQFMYLWLRMGGELRESWDSYRPRTAPEGGEFCQPLVDGPDNNPVNTAEDTFQQLISNANRYIWITTPYLAIDEPMIRTLCIAADSGVDVRLMLPGIPDHKFAYMVALSYFGELLEHDVKIFTYTPGLLHAKSVVADGDVGFVGSVNMDYRSFQLHFECGVLFSGSAVTAVQEDMDRVMAQSERVTLQGWRERKWYIRLLGTVLRPFAMWM